MSAFLNIILQLKVNKLHYSFCFLAASLSTLYSCSHTTESTKPHYSNFPFLDYPLIEITIKERVVNLYNSLKNHSQDEILSIRFENTDSIIIQNTPDIRYKVERIHLDNVKNIMVQSSMMSFIDPLQIHYNNSTFALSSITESTINNVRELYFENCNPLDLSLLARYSNLHILGISRCSNIIYPEAYPNNFPLDSFYLVLSPNILTLPDNITKIPNLRYIGLGAAQEKTQPSDDIFYKISQCKNLRTLFIVNLNKPQSKFMRALTVKNLELNNCNYDTLPEELYSISNLETLALRNNNITILPLRLSQMPNLKEVNLQGNPIKSIPDSLRTYFKHIKFDFGN